MAIKIINLEAGHPTVEAALARLGQELRTARAAGYRGVKIIHGYGSSGRGGAIKAGLPRYLADRRRQGLLRDYACGAEFCAFHPSGRRLVAALPELKRDLDYTRVNDGITVVIF